MRCSIANLSSGICPRVPAQLSARQSRQRGEKSSGICLKKKNPETIYLVLDALKSMNEAVVMQEHYYSVISKHKPITTFTLALIWTCVRTVQVLSPSKPLSFSLVSRYSTSAALWRKFKQSKKGFRAKHFIQTFISGNTTGASVPPFFRFLFPQCRRGLDGGCPPEIHCQQEIKHTFTVCKQTED